MKRNTQAGRLRSLLLLAWSCRWRPVPYGEKRRPSPRGRELLAPRPIRGCARRVTGGTEPFAAIAVYRNDVFLDQSEALGRSSLTVLTSWPLRHPADHARTDRSPPQDPSLRKAPGSVRKGSSPAGPVAGARPALRSGGTEDRDVDLLLRFVTSREAEERHVVAAGFRVVTRAGPTGSSPPMSDSRSFWKATDQLRRRASTRDDATLKSNGTDALTHARNIAGTLLALYGLLSLSGATVDPDVRKVDPRSSPQTMASASAGCKRSAKRSRWNPRSCVHPVGRGRP